MNEHSGVTEEVTAGKKETQSPRTVMIKLADLVDRAAREADLPEAVELQVIKRLSEVLGIIDAEGPAALGCCIYKADGQTLKQEMSESSCRALGGTWTPGPC
jgi:hypothetical protein